MNFRPQLEALEDRAVPAATFDWSGGTSSAWSDWNNWSLRSGTDGGSNDGIPDSDDYVYITTKAISGWWPAVSLNEAASYVNIGVHMGTPAQLFVGATLTCSSIDVYGILSLSGTGGSDTATIAGDGTIYIYANGTMTVGTNAIVNGTIDIKQGGTLTFGMNTSYLTVTTLTLSHASATIQMSANTDSNYIACTNINCNGVLTVSVANLEQQWTMIAYSGTKTGDFATVAFTGYNDGITSGWVGGGPGQFDFERDV